jgi:hypothetical protein
MFKYIIRADGYMATAVHSEKNWFEMVDFIREVSKPRNKREMPCLMVGCHEFINPVVMSVDDYANWLALLM